MTKPGFYQSWNGPKYQPPLLKPIMLLHRSSMAAAVMSGLCFILVLQARTVQGVYGLSLQELTYQVQSTHGNKTHWPTSLLHCGGGTGWWVWS